MKRPAAILAICALAAAAPPLHVPHTVAAAVAVASDGAGGVEIVAVVSARVDDFVPMRSLDEGMTWEMLAGEGVELAKGSDVVYHADMPSETGAGLFPYRNRPGVWAYHAGGGRVEAWSDGIPAADVGIVDLSVPMPGSLGPAALITTTGRVYTRFPGDPSWGLSVDFNVSSLPWHESVSVVPHFDPNGFPGLAQAIVASVNGHLKYMRDGGKAWGVHPQFNSSPDDQGALRITSVAFAEDFATSGVVILGRGRSDPEYGEILRSHLFGLGFQVVYTIDTEIGALLATPPGPDGRRYFYAAGSRYPWDGAFQQGILRSADGGITWDDFGNAQDFVLRENAGNPNQQEDLLYLKQVLVQSPYFSTDGEVYLSRQQGLWKSEDLGMHWRWRRIRPETDTRDLDTAIDAGGRRLLFGANYGSGLVIHDLGAGTFELPLFGLPIPYHKSLQVSPNYPDDGAVIVGGGVDLVAWFDPAVGATNPYGVTGWVDLPVTHPTFPTNEGYPRTVALSPLFDARADPGMDPTIFWNVFANPPYRSEDVGQTAALVRRVAGTSEAQQILLDIEVAPTYDGNSPATKNDAYGIRWDGKFYVLEDDVWKLIHDFGSEGIALSVDPFYTRPANPRVFVVTREGPTVSEVVDQPGSPVVIDRSSGLEEVLVTDLAFARDFDVNPLLYASTLCSGAFRMDLSQPAPVWEPLGGTFPRLWAKAVHTSPDYVSDRKVFVGTSEGIYSVVDSPGAPWEQLPLSFFRDNERAAMQHYAPNDPANPQPDRTWKWTSELGASLPAPLQCRGPDMVSTAFDASRIETIELARSVRFLTAAGPGMGRVTLIVFNIHNGKVLRSQSVDLSLAAATLQNYSVGVQFQGLREVAILVETYVDPGEKVYFDGFEIDR